MDKNKPIKGIAIKLDIDIARTGDWYIEHYSRSQWSSILQSWSKPFPHQRRIAKKFVV